MAFTCTVVTASVTAPSESVTRRRNRSVVEALMIGVVNVVVVPVVTDSSTASSVIDVVGTTGAPLPSTWVHS